MQLTASRSLKFAYAITVLAAVAPIGLASSSWVVIATGKVGVGLIGTVLLVAFGIYRVATVFKNPYALSSYEVKGFVLVLRRVGIFALYVGAIIGILNWLSLPVMLGLFKPRSESGVEFFAVGLYLALLGRVGLLGIIAFELSRILGVEEHAHNTASA